MLSRIADSLFWLNRYMERADGMLRLAYTHYILSLDKDVAGFKSWKPVLQIFTPASPDEIASLERNTEAVLKKVLLDPSNTNSLKAIINKARENARGAQDHITKEVWEEVNSMYHLVNQEELEQKIESFQGLQVMQPLMRHAVYFAGITDVTMPRGVGWCFMNLGKYVERCLQTLLFTEKQLEAIRFRESDTNDIWQWRYLLYALSGYELHLKNYRSSNYNYNVLHQVLINENFTRSVMYSLQRIDHYLNTIVRHNTGEETAVLLRHYGRFFSRIRFMELNSLDHHSVFDFLEETRTGLLEFNHRLAQHFFSHA